MEGEKRLRRDPAARSRSAAQAEEAGWKSLWGREGAKLLGPLYAASAAVTRVSGRYPSGPRRFAARGAQRVARDPEGETANFTADDAEIKIFASLEAH